MWSPQFLARQTEVLEAETWEWHLNGDIVTLADTGVSLGVEGICEHVCSAAELAGEKTVWMSESQKRPVL